MAADRTCCRVFAWVLLLLCGAAQADDQAAAGTAGGPVGDPRPLGAQWQTFDSCPRSERPCGPVCMPESFACCDKASAAICPPGASCCGKRCGCGPCQRCLNDTCVPREDCQPDEARSASSGQGAGTLAGGGLGGALPIVAPIAVLGVAAGAETGSDQRDPRSPISP